MFLLGVAIFGLIVPNGLFIYWLLAEYQGIGPVLQDRLALAFIIDAFLALLVLSYHYARYPAGRFGWPWLVLLSLLGGLGFGLPFYWWLNGRQTHSDV